MELKHVRSFLAVAGHLHFGRAAEELHLSQPALSSQIHNLEEDLGVLLFRRDRRTVTLTAAGETFREEAQDLLVQAEHARRRVQLADRGLIGRLRVGFISSAAALLVPPLVIKFRELYPGVELDLRNVLTADQVNWLMEKKLDLGLLRLPVASEEFTADLLHKEPFAVFLPVDHPLSRHKKLRLEQLRGEKFVIYARKLAPGFHDLMMNMLLGAGVTPEIVQEAGEMYTIIALVAAGLGVAVLPRSAELHRIPGVVSRGLPSELPFSEIGIAVRKGEVAPAVKLFRDLALSMRGELAKLRVPTIIKLL